MIISRTPFRVSLFGGGSDFREYYRRTPGAVLTLAIDRYMYVTVNKRFDDTIRVSYTRTEIVPRLKDLQHELIREAMRVADVTKGVEITTIADLPAGIGLASSSVLTVGVLNALFAYRGQFVPAGELAALACKMRSTSSAARLASRTSTSPPTAGSSSCASSATSGSRWSRCIAGRRPPGRSSSSCCSSTPG